jgi:nitrite reductase/ring-hydroxylating ferredoxin subunit
MVGDPGSKGFEIQVADREPVRLFVVRKHGVAAAFLNRCPHTGAPLEWLPDQFLDPDTGFIQCAMHGALFRPDDGYCVRGPCVGRSLTALPLHERDGHLWVELPDGEPEGEQG